MTSDKSSFQPADTTSFDLLRMAAALQDILKRFFGKFEIEQPIWSRISEQYTPLLELIEAVKEQTETYLGGTTVNVSASPPVFFNATHKASLTTALTRTDLHDLGCHSDGNAMGTALTASNEKKISLNTFLKNQSYCIGTTLTSELWEGLSLKFNRYVRPLLFAILPKWRQEPIGTWYAIEFLLIRIVV
jgi:hypothetical protein